MSYRKWKAEYIFTGDDLLLSGTVLITDENGVIVNKVDERDAGDSIQSFQGMLTPGFINAHCHLELSHMKGKIDPGTGLVQFLTRVIKERGTGLEQVFDAMRQAELELLNSGTVAVGDICNTANSISIKNNSSLLYKNFIEVMGFREDQAADRFAAGQKIADAFEQHGALIHDRWQKISECSPAVACRPSILRPSLTPHAPYSVSLPLFTMINESSAGEVITIHNQETDAENQLYTNGTGHLLDLFKNLSIDASCFKASGRSSLQTYLPRLNKSSGVILVHNTYTQETDVLFASAQIDPRADLFFCVCINANRYIESKNPPLVMLRKNKCTIIMGTDSYASNWQLNMLEEVKAIHQQFP